MGEELKLEEIVIYDTFVGPFGVMPLYMTTLQVRRA